MTDHELSRRIDGSGCTDYCTCGLSFHAPYVGKVGRFETDEQRDRAVARADDMWREHVERTTSDER